MSPFTDLGADLDADLGADLGAGWVRVCEVGFLRDEAVLADAFLVGVFLAGTFLADAFLAGTLLADGVNLRPQLERAKGFEPSTPTLARLCSTPELRPQTGFRMAGVLRYCQAALPPSAKHNYAYVDAQAQTGALLLVSSTRSVFRRSLLAHHTTDRKLHRRSQNRQARGKKTQQAIALGGFQKQGKEQHTAHLSESKGERGNTPSPPCRNFVARKNPP